MKYRKQYIDVDVAISASGQMLPRIIHWTDGRQYTISKVKAVVPSPAMKAFLPPVRSLAFFCTMFMRSVRKARL